MCVWCGDKSFASNNGSALCCLFIVCLFVCLFVASSLPIVVCGVGISRLPVTRRRGSNNEKQQIHSQSIEATKKTLFGRVLSKLLNDEYWTKTISENIVRKYWSV